MSTKCQSGSKKKEELGEAEEEVIDGHAVTIKWYRNKLILILQHFDYVHSPLPTKAFFLVFDTPMFDMKTNKQSRFEPERSSPVKLLPDLNS